MPQMHFPTAQTETERGKEGRKARCSVAVESHPMRTGTGALWETTPMTVIMETETINTTARKGASKARYYA